MRIAVIDADLIGAKNHLFPNLACEKISAYRKSLGDAVVLKTNYDGLDEFDKIYISKVFTDTEIPGEPEDKSTKSYDTITEWYADNEFLKRGNVEYGGTGFFYDNAPPLPPEIEHAMPDYHLYDDWVARRISEGVSPSKLKYYTDYSIGFLTRGCFRGCDFCVNKNHRRVTAASPLEEFYDESRPKIVFLDDNFFGCPEWESLIEPVLKTKKNFQFRQGLDIRLLNEKKAESLARWKYDSSVSPVTFAFDNIADKELIISKLEMIRRVAPNWKKRLRFYVLCGFDRNGVYDDAFWENDIRDMFERIEIITNYGAHPYIMRFEKAYGSRYESVYTSAAAWCNQGTPLYLVSFADFCKVKGMRTSNKLKYMKERDIDGYIKDIGIKGKEWRGMEAFSAARPDISKRYFNKIMIHSLKGSKKNE